MKACKHVFRVIFRDVETTAGVFQVVEKVSCKFCGVEARIAKDEEYIIPEGSSFTEPSGIFVSRGTIAGKGIFK